jgi:hypothetical protein
MMAVEKEIFFGDQDANRCEPPRLLRRLLRLRMEPT